MADHNFDNWVDGKPDLGVSGDGSLDDWVDGEPVILQTESETLIIEDFEDETIGNAPANWTERWNVSEADLEVVASTKMGTKAVWIDGSSAGDEYFASYDPAGNLDDQEILCLVNPDYYSTVNGFGIGFRCSGSAGSENGYFIKVWGSNRTYISKIVNGTWTNLDYDSTTGMYNSTDYVWWRISAVGTALKVKAWAYGTEEPVSWTVEVTDSDISSAGMLGIYQENASWFDSKIEYLAIDTTASTITKPSDMTRWRLYITEVVSGSRTRIPEMEFNDTPGGTDLCTGGTATASEYYSTDVPANAFDDDTGTEWFTSTAQIPGWIEYEFADGFWPEELSLTANGFSYLDYTPTAFLVQYWDGDSWVTVRSVSGLSWTADETKTFTLGAPAKAATPDPTHQLTGVAIDKTLSWAAADGATSYDVYFGTSSPGTFQGNQSGLTFDPGTLDPSQTYYWRIDAKNANGTTTGDVWEFTTASAGVAAGNQPVVMIIC